MTRDVRERGGLPAADQKFLANIETHGWAVTKVFRSEGEAGPEFAYSTGLFHGYKHPEIVVFGLDLGIMHQIINNIGNAVKNAAQFKPGIEYHEIFARCGCQFRVVASVNYKPYLGWAIWFYESYEFPVLQCFWPDRDRHYPWERACSPGVAALQPLLF
jgi:hypothetical protein